MGLRTTESSHSLSLSPSLIPLHCGRQPHGAYARRGIESRRAEGEFNAVQTRRYRRFRDRHRREMRDETIDSAMVRLVTISFGTIMGEMASLIHVRP